MNIKRAMAATGVFVAPSKYPGNQAWGKALAHDKRPIQGALALLKAHRHIIAELAACFPDKWGCYITYPTPGEKEIGKITVGQMIRMVTDHLDEHLATIEAIRKKHNMPEPAENTAVEKPAVKALAPEKPAPKTLAPERPAVKEIAPEKPAPRAVTPEKPAIEADTRKKPALKAELIKGILDERKRLENALKGLTAADMAGPSKPDVWSVKDILGHIASWEAFFLQRYEAGLRGEKQIMPEWSKAGVLDAVNLEIYQHNRHRELADILKEFKESYQRIFKTVVSIPEEDMFTPGKYDWTGKNTLADYIIGNTSEHYAEHLGMIEAIKKKL
jgi:hypothetical protein